VHGLDTQLIAVIATVVVVWGVLSVRLERFDISAPFLFVVAGLLLANEPLSVIHVDIHSDALRSIAEVTLALLLFSDAARVNVRELRRDAGIPARLLFLGLPLTIALGSATAVLLFPSIDVWTAATIAACVAPTDAALGAQVVEDPNVPPRIRRVLGVESGLNDGIATPFVTFFLAGAVGDVVAHSSTGLSSAVGELAIGVVVGVVTGLVGSWLLRTSHWLGWSAPASRGITVTALALLAYAASIELGGNGFIAAFVGGLAFGTVLPAEEQSETLAFDAQAGELLSLVVWFLFGAVLVTALRDTTWETALFAVLAVTVIRMVPVAASLVGSGLSPLTVAFVGWFGPRGLASVVFGLIAFDALGGSEAHAVVSAVALTVLLSVVAHGITARPFSRRYGRRVADVDPSAADHSAVPTLPTRPRLGRPSRRPGTASPR
jgi:NhaP-type Na+/H+ or K+/H+ antiporter